MVNVVELKKPKSEEENQGKIRVILAMERTRGNPTIEIVDEYEDNRGKGVETSREEGKTRKTQEKAKRPRMISKKKGFSIREGTNCMIHPHLAFMS